MGMRGRRWAGVLAAAVAACVMGVFARGPVRAQEGAPAGETAPAEVSPEAKTVLDCLERNRPERTARQHVTFTCVDRLGQRRATEAELLGKQLQDEPRRGLHAARLHFTAPYDLRGSAFLINESVGRSNDMFFYSSATRMTRRVTGRATTGNLFCTDFSYEDFERWQLLNKPGHTTRLPDAELDGRPVHRIETRPAADGGSAYQRVVTSVDRETCVALRSESFESGEQPRKVLVADSKSLLHAGAMWLATKLEMRDLRDQTHTEVSIADVEVDLDIKDREFQPSALQSL